MSRPSDTIEEGQALVFGARSALPAGHIKPYERTALTVASLRTAQPFRSGLPYRNTGLQSRDEPPHPRGVRQLRRLRAGPVHREFPVSSRTVSELEYGR
jgi:hypothetical protein